MIELTERHREAIADLCQRCRVKRLELFGSAARTDFDAVCSDIDFLVEYLDSDWHRAADNWFGLLEGLEAIFNRRVDLVSAPDIKNRYFLEVANQSRLELYAA